ncbi:MAG: hypothetical protein ABIQ52_03990 [Vicinamibacterales bacterium]
MFRQVTALGLCAVMMITGCASASGSRVAQPSAPQIQDRAVLAEYVQRLAPGSKVRVERGGGESLRGTLMKATADAIVVQKNTRVPEPPIEIPLSDVSRVTLDSGGASVGRNIAIGIGSGVAATFGVLLLLAALLND